MTHLNAAYDGQLPLSTKPQSLQVWLVYDGGTTSSVPPRLASFLQRSIDSCCTVYEVIPLDLEGGGIKSLHPTLDRTSSRIGIIVGYAHVVVVSVIHLRQS